MRALRVMLRAPAVSPCVQESTVELEAISVRQVNPSRGVGRTLADLTPRPGRPHFSNFSPPAERRPFCKKVFGLGKKAWFSALVGHEGRWATLAGLVPICPRGHFSDLTPKYLTLVATTPGCGQALGRTLPPAGGRVVRDA
eukprot:scaffold26143_cov60-Phaeocystis_antarctica.AAC.6